MKCTKSSDGRAVPVELIFVGRGGGGVNQRRRWGWVRSYHIAVLGLLPTSAPKCDVSQTPFGTVGTGVEARVAWDAGVRPWRRWRTLHEGYMALQTAYWTIRYKLPPPSWNISSSAWKRTWQEMRYDVVLKIDGLTPTHTTVVHDYKDRSVCEQPL